MRNFTTTMKATVTTIGLLLTVLTSFSQTQTSYPTGQIKSSSVDTDKERLRKLKSSIDAKYNAKNSKVGILVKTPDNKLIEVKNRQFPDEVDVTFNLLKDSLGRLVLFKEIPNLTESGDDYIEITHYFDSEGRTFAITLLDNYFVEKGVAYWTKTIYYDNDFKEIGKVETLLDKNNKPLKKDNNYEFPYTTEFYPNKDLCLKIFDGFLKATLASTLPKIEDFLIPDKDHNKVTYYMPTKTGGRSGATKTLYFKKTAQGCDILDARFFEGQTTSIGTDRIIFENNEARLTNSISTNILVTNKHQTFSPARVLLKVPPKDGTVTWVYIEPSGDKYNCTASWTYDIVEEDGKETNVPVIKVVKTTPEIKGKILEFYRKGDGLVREQFIGVGGQLSTQFQVHSFSHDDDVDKMNMFK
jgi:hypothetical protein